MVKNDLQYLLSLVSAMRMQAVIDMADFSEIRRLIRLEEYLKVEIERYL